MKVIQFLVIFTTLSKKSIDTCIIFCIYFGAPLVLGTYIFFKLQKYYKNIGLYLFSSLYYDLKKIVSRIAFLLIILSFALDFLLS